MPLCIQEGIYRKVGTGDCNTIITSISSSSLGERVQQEGRDTVRLLGSIGNREMTFFVGKVCCGLSEQQGIAKTENLLLEKLQLLLSNKCPLLMRFSYHYFLCISHFPLYPVHFIVHDLSNLHVSN